MTKLPYVFDPNDEHANDPPWTKLATIAEHLEDRTLIPPSLARWLREAIRGANGDAKALLLGLGLRKPQGRPSEWDKPQAPDASQRLWDLVSGGMPDEVAIRTVQEEFAKTDGDDQFSRSTLQRWLTDVRQADDDAWGTFETE